MPFESRNPTAGERIATYPEHTGAEVERRLQLAWDGWKSWSRTSRVQGQLAIMEFRFRPKADIPARAKTQGNERWREPPPCRFFSFAGFG